MLDLRISSKMNLHAGDKSDLSGYIREGLAFLKNAGFDAADFTVSLLDPLGENWQPCVEQTLADAREIGLGFAVCHLPYSVKICTDPAEAPVFSRKMYRAIDIAAALGVSYAVLHPNTTTLPLEDFDRRAQYDSVMHHMAPFAEYAQRAGVQLAVENMRLVHGNRPVHRYCQKPDELCEIADALGIGVCWDFGHANTCHLRQSEALQYVGKRLKTVHVNDNTAFGDDHVPPFCGTVDWKDAMQGLAAIGYSGPFNYEIQADRVPASAREVFAGYLLACAKEMLSW